MARTPTPRGRLLLLASVALLANSTLAESTCYNTWGEVDTNQQPCFAPGTADTGATTWCCSKSDYCLSNGLCLSPGSSNLMTQQGCTDKNWGGSCKKFCPASNGERPCRIPTTKATLELANPLMQTKNSPPFPSSPAPRPTPAQAPPSNSAAAPTPQAAAPTPTPNSPSQPAPSSPPPPPPPLTTPTTPSKSASASASESACPSSSSSAQ